MADSLRSVAIRAARESGAILRGLFGRVAHIRYKGEIDLVTEADEQSEQVLLRTIRENFPEHVILSEESGLSGETSGAAGYRWLIDPLDGTTNFAHGYPVFAVSIGLELDGELRLGVVYAPLLDELFVAERGQGATLNGERIAVSTTDSLRRSLLASGFQYDQTMIGSNLIHWENFLYQTRGLRRDGSAALDLCHVAAGRLDGYWEQGLFPWDSGAGTLMIREAGGVVTNYQGEPFAVSHLNCVASNGLIHQPMLEAIRRGLAGERIGATSWQDSTP